MEIIWAELRPRKKTWRNCSELLHKKAVLESFVKRTRKQIRVTRAVWLRPAFLLKFISKCRCFLANCATFFRAVILYNTCGSCNTFGSSVFLLILRKPWNTYFAKHLRTAASESFLLLPFIKMFGFQALWGVFFFALSLYLWRRTFSNEFSNICWFEEFAVCLITLISLKVKCVILCNFIEIALPHGCCPVNLLHIFTTPFLNNTSGWLLLFTCKFSRNFHRFCVCHFDRNFLFNLF